MKCLGRFEATLLQIPRTAIKDHRNFQYDSGKCSKRFLGMFKKVQGNVQQDFGESFQF